MSLRDLFFNVGFKGDTRAITDMNSAVDATKDTVKDATEEIRKMDSAKSTLQRTADRTGRFLQDNWRKITLATTAGATAMEMMVRRQSELTRQTNLLSESTDMASGEVRAMVNELTDHTFSTQDALSAMQRLTRSGYDTEEQFRELLPIFDTFSDATGIHIVDAIDLFDRTLSALGEPLTEAEKHMDTFTWLTQHTTVQINEMAQLMRREAGTLKDMGLSVDDIALAMSSLHAEGIRGPRAVQGLQSALSDSEGDINAFWGALAASEETLASQYERMLESAGMTERYAQTNNDATTTLQRLNSNMQNTIYNYGALFEVLNLLTVPLLAIGPMFKVLSMLKIKLLVPAIKSMTASIALATKGLWFFLAPVLKIMAPILLIIGLIALLGYGIYQLWKNWDNVTDWITSKWGAFTNWIGDKISSLWGWFTDLGSGMWDIGRNIIDGLVGGIKDKFKSAVDAVRNVASGIADGVKGFFGINSPSKLMMEYGVNLSEGLSEGIEREPVTTDNLTQRPLAGNSGGQKGMVFSPTVNITVNGESNVQETVRNLEREFDELMERYARKLELRNPAITVG